MGGDEVVGGREEGVDAMSEPAGGRRDVVRVKNREDFDAQTSRRRGALEGLHFDGGRQLARVVEDADGVGARQEVAQERDGGRRVVAVARAGDVRAGGVLAFHEAGGGVVGDGGADDGDFRRLARGGLRGGRADGEDEVRLARDDALRERREAGRIAVGVAAVDRDVFSLSISRVRKSCLDAALRRQERVVRGGREDGDAKLVVRRTAMHRKECERADDGERDEHGDEVEARDAHEESPCQVGRKLV